MEEAVRIDDLLKVCRADEHVVNWGTLDRKSEAFAIAKAIAGYDPSNKSCLSCNIKIANILREAVGLPPISQPAGETLYAHRIAICEQCPAFASNTLSCGRLIFDAMDPQPVNIDGTDVHPCGCYLPLKARIKSSKCPASKW